MIKEIEGLINSGRYFEAHNMAQKFCATHPDNIRAYQLCGLAMSKSGARNAAINFLEPVLAKNPADVETAGILGGVYKEAFKMTADTNYARKSHETYLANFEKTKSYYTGINAATMSQILGRGRAAREIASQVVDIAGKDDSFWANATVGEAYLLLRDPVKAKEYYTKAAKLGDSQYGMMGSVYAQLLVLKHFIIVPEPILKLFAPPKVAMFAGHMIDHNREFPRFPESISEQVKRAIKAELIDHNIRIGFSSLACGSDILFVEAILELGGEVNLFLPFDRDNFLETSVIFAGEDWVKRFERLEAKNKITYITRSKYKGNDELFRFLGKVMIGASVIRAALFHDKPFFLTVASERDQAIKTGGTTSIRTIWPYDHSMIHINSDIYLPMEASNSAFDQQPPVESKMPFIERKIQYFALATIDEREIENKRAQVDKVYEKIRAEFIEFPGAKRSGCNDKGIFALYTKAHYAMDFSLRLLSWARQQGLAVKIALEAILVKKGKNPMEMIEKSSNLKSLAFNDACYATMQFAAALSAEQAGRYDFHHVGIIQSGKIDEGQEIYRIDQKEITALS